MVALILESDGYSVLTAGNGPDAIDLSRSHQGAIDLVVSDVRMPVMDGCTLAGELQAENPEMPVLLISGDYGSVEEERSNRFPVLPKPFSMTSLLMAVRGVLSKKISPLRRRVSPKVTSADDVPELEKV
jgi:two-component system cell cycle sensor histidine kinase/response regulator CckA